MWSGKPVKVPFILSSLVTIPFGLIFLGFSIFWMWGAASAGAPWFFTLFGLLFVFMGFGLTVGAPIWQLMRYPNTEYMITDQRIITQTGAIGLDTRFINLDKIQEVYVKIDFVDKMFGTGSVIVMTAGYVPVGYDTTGRGALVRPSLDALKEPYEVQKLIQEAIEKVRAKKLA